MGHSELLLMGILSPNRIPCFGELETGSVG